MPQKSYRGHGQAIWMCGAEEYICVWLSIYCLVALFRLSLKSLPYPFPLTTTGKQVVFRGLCRSNFGRLVCEGHQCWKWDNVGEIKGEGPEVQMQKVARNRSSFYPTTYVQTAWVLVFKVEASSLQLQLMVEALGMRIGCVPLPVQCTEPEGEPTGQREPAK